MSGMLTEDFDDSQIPIPFLHFAQNHKSMYQILAVLALETVANYFHNFVLKNPPIIPGDLDIDWNDIDFE
jgi:hypothetical protein